MTVIDPRLQVALDGERDPDTLPVELREDYARLTGAIALLRKGPGASVADRVMAQIRREAPVFGPLRLRPLWMLAVAAAVAAVVFLPFREQATPGPDEV